MDYAYIKNFKVHWCGFKSTVCNIPIGLKIPICLCTWSSRQRHAHARVCWWTPFPEPSPQAIVFNLPLNCRICYCRNMTGMCCQTCSYWVEWFFHPTLLAMKHRIFKFKSIRAAMCLNSPAASVILLPATHTEYFCQSYQLRVMLIGPHTLIFGFKTHLQDLLVSRPCPFW